MILTSAKTGNNVEEAFSMIADFMEEDREIMKQVANRSSP